MQGLIAKLEAATEGSEQLDAEITAELHNARVERYPPTDDFGPKDRWQFWSRDGQHFLGNERKFPVLPYTTSIDAALTLVPEGWGWGVRLHESGPPYTAHIRSPDGALSGYGGARFDGDAPTPALAICIAALKAHQRVATL